MGLLHSKAKVKTLIMCPFPSLFDTFDYGLICMILASEHEEPNIKESNFQKKIILISNEASVFRTKYLQNTSSPRKLVETGTMLMLN